ncbi:MAG: sugar porter family MFS transporter [Terrimicrobiaceae bacterium]|nr:sugar porter family MFS transporter [Terrimicrobiaceae bacterium]
MTPPVRKPKFIVYFIGFTAALAGLLFGLDVGVISGAQSFIQTEFKISNDIIQYVVSALLWGAVAGTLISGFLSSRFGRRKTILISAIIFIVGSLLCAFAHSEHWLIAARFLLGIAVGVASFTAPLYLSEISPQVIRGSMISMYQLMITIGIVLAFLSDTWLASYATFGGVTGGHWRIMLGVIAIPAAVMFLGVLFLPESPRWLFLKGFKERGIAVFTRMHLDDAQIASEVKEIEDSLLVKQSGFQMLLTNRNFARAIGLGVGLQIIQQLTGINVIMYYAPRIFQIAGFETTIQQMWGTVIVGVTNVLATFIAIAFVDRLGRKPIMYAGFVVMGSAMITVGILFNIGVEKDPSLGYPAMFALLLFIIGFAMSAGPIIWVICSEVYPLAGRDLGVTFSTATNWVANAIVGQTFLTLLMTLGNGNTFLLYGALNVLFIVFFLLFVPETKGVSLEKIESNLLSGLPLRKIGR